MNRTFGRGHKSHGCFVYAIDIVAIECAVDRKVPILARWEHGRCAAAAGNADSGIADAAGMVPGSLCRCRRSAPDLHGASRTGREESQFPEHSEGRERPWRHALGTSCRTRKGRLHENREAQGSRCSPRQEPCARRGRDAGAERPRAQGIARRDSDFVETRSSKAHTSSENQRQRIFVSAIAAPNFRPSQHFLAVSGIRIHNRAVSGQPYVWPDCVAVHALPWHCGPINRQRTRQT
jgi:hypothetical protein